MVDFHTHIIPHIDDGARSIEECINLIRDAKSAGFDTIVLTPHYYEGLYEYNEEERKKILESIENVLMCLNINIKLYLGSEIYMSSDIVELLKQKKASTLNNSKYVLFEVPFNTEEIKSIKTMIYKLIENDNIPILAHPERYIFVQENPDILEEFKDLGVLFQGNYGSIIGAYGSKAQKTFKKLLKNDLINFLGSDVHRSNTIYPKMDKALRKIEKIVGKARLNRLTEINPSIVLQDIKMKI